MVGKASIFLAIVCVMAAVEANTDDVWISVEDRVDSFSNSGNYSVVVPGAKHIIGLSNPVFHNNEFSAIFATELGVRGPSVYKIGKTDQVLLADSAAGTDEMPSYFEGIAVDQLSNQLFLTSKNSRAIFKMPAEIGGKPTKFLSTLNKKPTGISIDSCSRNVFWTNSDRKLPSIEVFQPDTGSSWTLINTNLTRPRAINVDIPERKVYWTDTSRGAFWISRSNLDGTEREVVCKAKDHEAFSIVVTEEFIYWSDWTSHALWRTSKSGDCNFELIQKFTTSKPHGVSFIPDTKYNCNEYQDVNEKPIVADLSTTTTTEKPPPDTSVNPVEEDDCTNYCLNGDCLKISGEPSCECYEGYAGPRCQIDKCLNFCLEDGECVIIDDEPECLCQDGFQGDRCQVANLPNENQVPIDTVSSSKFSAISENMNILVYVLGGTTGALTIVVIVLSVLLNRMRLRPRIVRKRFISVAGANRKDADISKPNSSCGLPVDDGIQLDIENCCNMTLCDTPCFEPSTRGPKKSKLSKNRAGAQDKKSLLEDDDEDY